MIFKKWLRKVLIALKWDITKNLEYDRLTKVILQQKIAPHFNCVDVGCHQGEILEILTRLAPKGKHFAFEPLPQYYNLLVKNFSHKAEIYPYALSDKEGRSNFNYVRNAPAYSGLKLRKYNVSEPNIEEITVELRRLDDIIPRNLAIHFVKIDVEGGEMDVLKGGLETLRRCQPLILFEFGVGASEFYGYKPEEIFQFLTKQIGLSIFTLNDFINHKDPLTLRTLEYLYQENKEYYFIASVF
jgi:FkbM family methyltransferase